MKHSERHLTKSAAAILEALANSDLPMNVYQISKITEIPVPTIYRNMSILEKESLVKSFQFRGFSYYYSTNKHAHYFVCNSCGEITPIRSCQIQNSDVEKLTAGKVFDHMVIYQGICKECLRKEGKM